jgi:uncharacterized tellurite resistance protein B-like protein
MLQAIKDFVERQIISPTEDGSRDSEHALRLATAALLVEMSRQDDQVYKAEREAATAALSEHFGLDMEEVATLYVLAEAEADDATDYYQFTSLLKEHLGQQQKEQVIELLWQVAVADGHIDPYEEHMVRRIAELLYLPHSAFIRAKHRVIGMHEAATGSLSLQ